jgi:hypothetical protein
VHALAQFIDAARALSHFANKKGVNINDKEYLVAIRSHDGLDIQ